ncbi:MAG: subclass B1 metallo-beta-lactamase [Acidobacteria bacterium]|nr:subclass B1 metallo-beta-lactamase [Acidobacteriota bacterium]
MLNLRLPVLLLAMLLVPSLPPSFAAAKDNPPTIFEMATDAMTPIGESVWVSKLAPNLWVVTATGEIGDGAVYPANGMALESPAGTVLVDPGWNDAQARALLRWSRETLKKPVVKAIATHSHRDRLGGIAALAEAGIPMLVNGRTRSLAEAAKAKHLPQAVPDLETKPYRDAAGFELFFPGGGHTPDNIVVYFPEQRVVFGGCLIKSVTSDNLGNIADAVMSEYPATIERVAKQYPEPRIVVPGHGTITGDGLAHTLKLLAEHAAKP